MYDKNNVFAKIIRGEIPKDFIVENKHALSFYDINPDADIHVLVVPRGEYKNVYDFVSNADTDEQVAFWQVFRETLDKLGLTTDYNIDANTGNGPFGGQSVMHFHLHILGGKRLLKKNSSWK